MTESLKITVNENGDRTVVHLTGMLDTASAPQFKEFIDRLLERDYLNLKIDMSSLDYVSSIGIRSLLTLIKKMHERQQNIVFSGIKEAVCEIFDLSGLSDIMTIE